MSGGCMSGSVWKKLTPPRPGAMLQSLLAVLLFSGYGIFATTDRPNIVFIVADDMGWDGGDVKKTLDALAAEGVVITRPSCTPSRTALLTERYPIRSETVRYLDKSAVVAALNKGLLNNTTFYNDNYSSNWPLRGHKMSRKHAEDAHQLFHMTDWLPTLDTAIDQYSNRY